MCCGHDEKSSSEIVDLERPLEGDCTFELIDFNCPEGREVSFYSFQLRESIQIFSFLRRQKSKA